MLQRMTDCLFQCGRRRHLRASFLSFPSRLLRQRMSCKYFLSYLRNYWLVRLVLQMIPACFSQRGPSVAVNIRFANCKPRIKVPHCFLFMHPTMSDQPRFFVSRQIVHRHHRRRRTTCSSSSALGAHAHDHQLRAAAAKDAAAEEARCSSATCTWMK